MKIAVVGTGISGLACAHLLDPHHDVHVFEAADRVGGHAHTVRVDLDDETHMADTGFLVYNEANYPGFCRLLDRLGVGTHESDMSFSVSADDGSFEYRGLGPNRLFAQRSNLVRPGFHRFLADILRFNRDARGLLQAEEGDVSLGAFVSRGRYSPRLALHYLVPIGSAIWSADPGTFMEMPALTFARFFDQHGLLGGFVSRPRWRTVTGGSVRYVSALVERLARPVRTSSAVEKVLRRPDGVEVLSRNGPEWFDAVVMATHSDQALGLLSDASPAEREVLGALRFQANTATLHHDASVLPRRRRAWASWNYHLPAGLSAPSGVAAADGRRAELGSAGGDAAGHGAAGGGAARLTYYLNRLQGFDSRHHLCVTLNDDGRVDPAKIFARIDYEHPVLDGAAVRAQARRGDVQGHRRTYFAGAYWANGFHEDGVQSALDVTRRLGVTM